MSKKSQRMIEIVNNRLTSYQQKIRVVEWNSTHIKLSNGMVLHDNDRLRFIRRIKNTKTDLWIKNIDNLLDNQVSEHAIRSALSTIGGKSCQNKHGEKIKLNLNTGVPWNKNMKGNYPYLPGPPSQETKNKIGLKNFGINNGMYGVKYTDEQKYIKSEKMKNLIKSGEFTPNSNNQNTHWECIFDGKYYRSSWEALYQYYNSAAEYEKLRIEYEIDGIKKIYIVDFIDYINKLVIEIKPQELCNGKKFESKISALQQWASKNNFTVLIVDQQWFRTQIKNIEYDKFDEKTATKIRKLYEVNQKNRNIKNR